MRKIFIDCGTHLGQGILDITRLKNIDNSWEIIGYEANPYTHRKFCNEVLPNLPFKNITIRNEAISDKNGMLWMNIETRAEGDPLHGDYGEGSSIIGLDKWLPQNHWGKYIKKEHVPCIDFSEYLSKNVQPNDFVLIKMDIEGAEYQVLEKMIKDGVPKLIDCIIIEWHSRFFDNPSYYFNLQPNIMREFTSKGVEVIEWH